MLYSAMRMCLKMHLGQKRRGGEPYFKHPFRVAGKMNGDFEKCVALLHDSLEDSNYDDDYISERCGEEVLREVKLLTKNKGESYDDYIDRVLTSEVATKVKIADMEDNISDNPSERQIKKYSKYIPILRKRKIRDGNVEFC